MKQQPQPPVQMDQITAGASVVIWSTYPLLQLPDNWIVQQAACFPPPQTASVPMLLERFTHIPRGVP